MTPRICSLVCTLSLTLVTSCGVERPELGDEPVGHSSQDVIGPCTSCTDNVNVDGIRFGSMRIDGTEANELGNKIESMSKDGSTYKFGVQNERIVGLDPTSGSQVLLSGQELIGATFQIYGPDAYATIEKLHERPYWVEDLQGVTFTTYEISVQWPGGNVTSFCPSGSPNEVTITMGKYNQLPNLMGYIDVGSEADWFSFACTRGALYKTKSLGLYLWDTTPARDERQATLNMIMANYCDMFGSLTGVKMPFAYEYWDGSIVRPEKQEATEYPLEALWDEEGVLCLNEPRLKSRSQVLSACPYDLPRCDDPVPFSPGQTVADVAREQGDYVWATYDVPSWHRSRDVATQGTATQSADGSQAWWELELDAQYEIQEIHIFNCTNGCTISLGDFYVLVSDTPFSGASLDTAISLANYAYYQSGQLGEELILPTSVVGQYVRVQLAGSGSPSLGGVEVWGRSAPANIASQGTASQSSDYDVTSPATTAIDGIDIGVWSQTAYEFQPWWEIDLGMDKLLLQIDISQTDIPDSLREDFYVLISDTPFTSSDLTLAMQQADYTHYQAGHLEEKLTLAASVVGRYVRVQLADSGSLGLTEVNLWTISSPIVAPQQLSYASGENMVINWVNGSGHDESWVGVYPKGSVPGNEAADQWVYTNGTYVSGNGVVNGSHTFTTPSKAGDWTVFLFQDNGYTELAHYDFAVVPPPTIIPDKMYYAPGEVMTMTWANGADHPASWVGVYPKGIIPANHDPTDWVYTNGWFTPGGGIANGSTIFAAPTDGDWTVFLFPDGGHTPTASHDFTVTSLPTITVDKSYYAIDEFIEINWINGSGDDWSWIGINPKGSDPNTYYWDDWEYTNGTMDPGNGVVNGRYVNTWPPMDGEWTVFLFPDDGFTPIASHDFTITSSPTITTDKSYFSSDEPIVVSWINGSGHDESWVGIYPKDSIPGNQFASDWIYANGKPVPGNGIINGEHTFFSSLPDGEWTVYLFQDGGYTALASHDFTVTTSPYNQQLLQNADGSLGDMSHWTPTADGGDGWLVHARRFYTSYDWNRRTQVIDLYEHGHDTNTIANSSGIYVSERFQRVYCPDFYYLKVELLDASMNVLDTFDTGTVQQTGPCDYQAAWETVSHTFVGYSSNVRYVRWEDGGKDSECWAGHYGPQLDDAVLGVLP